MTIYKSPLDLRKTLDITDDVNAYFGKFPKQENESYEDYDARVYGGFADKYSSTLERDALNNIYENALKQAYFGQPIDDDYERSFGSVDTPEKFQSYLKWKNGNY